MKRSLLLLVSMLCTSLALAEPPTPPGTAASELVNKQLLVPLKRAESRRSKFSRAAPVASQRRVRVLDAVALTDARGKEFVRFAIDERRSWENEGVWHEDKVLGCAYLNEREVFVQRGSAYFAARSMLGQREKEQAGVCRAAPQAGAQIVSR